MYLLLYYWYQTTNKFEHELRFKTNVKIVKKQIEYQKMIKKTKINKIDLKLINQKIKIYFHNFDQVDKHNSRKLIILKLILHFSIFQSCKL